MEARHVAHLSQGMAQSHRLSPFVRAALALAALAAAILALAGRADAFVYWGNSSSGTIARANLDGTGVNQSFMTGVGTPAGVAVDNRGIYWVNQANVSGTIGFGTLNGKAVLPNFIDADADDDGLAVDSDFVYWTSYRGAIWRTARR